MGETDIASDVIGAIVMEGGYAVEAIGVNAVGVLEGFER
jgi:acetoin utilization deacetylase AcuC-like enzyme